MKNHFTVWARESYTKNPDAILHPASNHGSYARAMKAGMKQYNSGRVFHIKDNYSGKVVACGLPALGYLKEYDNSAWAYKQI